MDTKLKNILRSRSLQIITFILTILFLTSGFCLLMQTAMQGEHNFNTANDQANYTESKTLFYDIQSVYRDLYSKAIFYGSVDNIKSGATIDESNIDAVKTDLYYDDLDKDLWQNIPMGEVLTSTQFLKLHEKDIQAARDLSIDNALVEYTAIENSLKALEKEFGLEWIIEKGGKTESNVKGLSFDALKKSPVYFIDDKGSVETSLSDAQYGFSIGAQKANTDTKIGLSFSADAIAAKAEAYKNERAMVSDTLQIFFGTLLAAMVTFTLSAIGTGHRDESDTITLQAPDTLYWDIHGCLILMLCGFLVTFATNIALPLYFSTALIGLCVIFIVNFLLSIIRLFKAHSFWNHCFTVKVCQILFHGAKKFLFALKNYYFEVIKGSSTTGIFFVIIIVCAGIGSLIVLAPPLGLILLFFVLWYGGRRGKTLDEIVKGVDKIESGDRNYTIPINGDGPIENFAQKINAIRTDMAKTVDAAVEKELKSERLKTELITNVSHDIRTPLTSIITYIDLLKKEDLTEENRQKYIDVIDRKAERLKVLTDNLFEAAKASTGNLEVTMENVNLSALMNQGMGEFEDKIEAAELDFVVAYPEEKVMVKADGRLLWRIIENLLSNVLKYAMPASRVYITIEKDAIQQTGRIIIKNVSASPLNLPADELMERCKRGDISRSTEGSGLGLAITRDLANLQDGTFLIDIDGDLFKAIVSFNLSE